MGPGSSVSNDALRSYTYFPRLLPAPALSIRTMVIILGPCLMEVANELEGSAPNTAAPLCCLRKQN